ncbi:MAG TPA: SIS domain-containing protein [Methanospirillum sp.]|nr:SIS domain-containing protein [Methanospirillum sp.]
MKDITDTHARYLARVYASINEQEPEILRLIELIRTSRDVHLTGFGRSLCIAQIFGIRLFHFREHIKGTINCTSDMIRAPVTKGSILITCSGSGSRPETICNVNSAKSMGAFIALVTAEDKSHIREIADLIITIPRDKGEFYGAGDFEQGAYACFEVIISLMGKTCHIPKEVVERWHV